eukprot:1368697-Amorphochlora_amoeboformis.AAC.1
MLTTHNLLLTVQIIASAMQSLARSDDVQNVKNRLRHDDALTLGPLISVWHELAGLSPPLEYAGEDPTLLSAQ